MSSSPSIDELINRSNDPPRPNPPQLAGSQAPHTLWFGCSDSRVSEAIVTRSGLGEIFVHRNIANQFLDDSAHAALEFALRLPQGSTPSVRNVVVVGHSNCGAAHAAVQAVKGYPPNNLPITSKWLSTLIERVRGLNISHLDVEEAVRRVVDANVQWQIDAIKKTDAYLHAQGTVELRGLVYEIGPGILRDANPL